MLYNDHFQEETWKDIHEYSGIYQVSNMGNIRSIDRIVTQYGHKQNYTRIMRGKAIKPRLQNGGYLIVWLCKNGISKPFTVHRIVAKHFINNEEQLTDINHMDGNKKNNKVENLEWCTRSYNVKHSYLMHDRKLKGVAVKCVELDIVFRSIKEAGIKMNINPACVEHVLAGRNKTAGGYTWKRA